MSTPRSISMLGFSLLVLFSGRAYAEDVVDPALEASVRKSVYGASLSITTTFDEGGRRTGSMLIVPADLKAAYAKDPAAVRRLLIKIVEGARPSDAHKATCFAKALITNPVAAGSFAALEIKEDFDEIREGQKRTMRQTFLMMLGDDPTKKK